MFQIDESYLGWATKHISKLSCEICQRFAKRFIEHISQSTENISRKHNFLFIKNLKHNHFNEASDLTRLSLWEQGWVTMTQ